MIWNHALHLLAGALWANYMTWSGQGVLASTVVALILQAIDTVRLHIYLRRRFLADPLNDLNQESAPGSSLYWYKIAQFYVFKVIWYGLVTLVAAQIMRSLNA